MKFQLKTDKCPICDSLLDFGGIVCYCEKPQNHYIYINILESLLRFIIKFSEEKNKYFGINLDNDCLFTTSQPYLYSEDFIATKIDLSDISSVDDLIAYIDKYIENDIFI